MSAPTAIKVYICNLAGEFLTGSGEEWSFTPERAIAHIFDYHADEVAAQLEQAHRELGVAWVAYPVDLSLIGETCDACGQRLRSAAVTFDGTRYLCFVCRIPSQTR